MQSSEVTRLAGIILERIEDQPITDHEKVMILRTAAAAVEQNIQSTITLGIYRNILAPHEG